MKTLLIALSLLGNIVFVGIVLLVIWHAYKADLRAWWKARKGLRLVLNMIGTYLLLATVILLCAFGLIVTTP
jgi:hypothetical protein